MASDGVADTSRHIAVVVALTYLTAFSRGSIAVAARPAQFAMSAIRQILTTITLANALVASRMTVAQTILVAVGSSPSQLAFTLIFRRTGTVAVDALFKTRPVTEGFTVAPVSAFARAQIRPRRVCANGIRVAIVMTESALVHVGALRVRPFPRQSLLVGRWNLAQQRCTIACMRQIYISN